MNHALTRTICAAPVLVCLLTGPALARTDEDPFALLREEAVVEAASRHSQPASQAPAEVTVISRVDIDRYGWLTLADVLRSVRGFYVSDDHNYSYAGVRGFSRPSDYNNRILLMLNGHRLNATPAAATVAMMDVAAGTLNDADFAAWIRRHSEPVAAAPAAAKTKLKPRAPGRP